MKEKKTVYLSFSTDIIHGGHIAIIRKAQQLGDLIVGVLSDEAVAGYKRFPLVPASERRVMFENIARITWFTGTTGSRDSRSRSGTR